VGWWQYRGQLAATFLMLFVAIRTLAMTQLQTVEQRYVIECFPVIVALGALALATSVRRSAAEDGFETRRDISIAG